MDLRLRRPASSCHGGFSVTEVLVVIALLLALLLFSQPAYRVLRERTTASRCVANLRQMGAATFQYASEHRNELPYY